MVIWSLAQHRPSLAVGNIVGAAISNILGAFSLGLIFGRQEQDAQFDRSSRIYSALSFIITTVVTVILLFPHILNWFVCGIILTAVFAVYIVSIGLAISRGSISPPEDSDSDTSSDDDDSESNPSSEPAAETDPLLRGIESPVRSGHRERRSLWYHFLYLIFGFLAICLAGYILSHAAANIADAAGISDILFGVVILAIATTLPEKFIAVLSGRRGYMGILAANTAGSNIFLLTLCLGIILVDTSGELNGGGINITELMVLWTSSAIFTATVWTGTRFYRWVGAIMIAGYAAFIILEFTVVDHKQRD